MFDSASLLRNFNFSRFSRLPHFLDLSFGGTVTDEHVLALIELAKSMKTASDTSSHVTFDFRRSHLGEYLEVLRSFCIEITGASAIHAIHVVGNAGRDDMLCLQLVLCPNTPLKSLALKETNFGMDDISMIKEFFCTNDKLEDLELCSNAFLDDIAIGSILEWVQKSGSNPKSLLISDHSVEENTASKLTDSIIFYVERLVSKSPQLSQLHLCARNITNSGVTMLASTFDENCTIKRLTLGGNFGDSGLKNIADALKRNNSIITIHFTRCGLVSDAGGNAILEATYNCDSLQSVIDSNHTLTSVRVQPEQGMSKEVINKLRWIRFNSVLHSNAVKPKMILYLKEKIESNSLEGFGIKMMPFVIEFICQHGSHSMLYRLLRSWNMPIMFSNPSRERIRMETLVEILEQKNDALACSLQLERGESERLRLENERLWKLLKELGYDIERAKVS